MSSRTKMLLKLVLAVVCVGYLAVCGYMYSIQGSLIFPAKPGGDRTPAAVGLKFEEIFVDTPDGQRIHAWYVHAEPPAGSSEPIGVVHYSHGNAGNLSNRVAAVEFLAKSGFDVMIYDYRGYGRSSAGPPGEAGLYIDAKAVWDYLRHSRGVEASKIMIYGRSLGGGVASWLASEVEAAALVIVSSYTRLPEVGAREYPWLPVRLLLSHKFPTLDRIGAVGEPVIIAHSEDDALIPVFMGKALFAAASEPKQYVELVGDHNNAVFQSADTLRPVLQAVMR